jgi:hypothetical protein
MSHLKSIAKRCRCGRHGLSEQKHLTFAGLSRFQAHSWNSPCGVGGGDEEHFLSGEAFCTACKHPVHGCAGGYSERDAIDSAQRLLAKAQHKVG